VGTQGFEPYYGRFVGFNENGLKVNKVPINKGFNDSQALSIVLNFLNLHHFLDTIASQVFAGRYRDGGEAREF